MLVIEGAPVTISLAFTPVKLVTPDSVTSPVKLSVPPPEVGVGE